LPTVNGVQYTTIRWGILVWESKREPDYPTLLAIQLLRTTPLPPTSSNPLLPSFKDSVYRTAVNTLFSSYL
jgi:hypothetical protein